MIKEEFKNRAYELRKLGRSYNFIKKELGISKSTLSYWFQYIDWSRNVKQKNAKEIEKISTNRIILMNKARRKQSIERHEKMKEEAIEEFEKYKDNPVFIGGLMLYLEEGDKSINNNNGHLRICNTDPFVLKIFIKFLIMFCDIKIEKIRFWLLCYPDHNIEKCLNWWSESIKINRSQFYKTQVIQGRHKEKKLLYGVGNITITSAFLKTKVLKWVELMSDYLSRV